MTVNIIYKSADKGDITHAMLDGAAKVSSMLGYSLLSICQQKKLLRQAMEAAREKEIERIEVNKGHDGSGINIRNEIAENGKKLWWLSASELMMMGAKCVHVPLMPDNIIPLGDALIKLGKQINNEKE